MITQDMLFIFGCLIFSIMIGGVLYVVGLAGYEYLMEQNGD